MSDNRPSVYEDNGLVIYRASDIGGCITRLAAARQGREKIAPRGKQQSIYDAGIEAEEKFYKRHPELAHYRQMEVRLHITSKIVVVGHLDHWVDGMGEVKSQSDEEFKKWTWDSWEDVPLWKKYAWQVSVCMLALEEKPAQHNTLYRVNRDTDEEDPLVLWEPFHSKEEIDERILEVEALALEGELRCSTPDFFCSYPYLHPSAEPVDDAKLEEWSRLYLSLKGSVEVYGEHMDEIKKKIDARMKELGLEKALLMSGTMVSMVKGYDVKEHTVKGSYREASVRITGAK